MSGTISAIITSYNYGQFLPEAIESVLSQTVKPSEIILYNDGSSDNTREIGKRYESSHEGFFKYFENPVNEGIVKTFNSAVSEASGDYICFLGADNIFQDNYFEECKKVLDENPDVAIAYTDYVLFGDRAETVYNNHQSDRQGGTTEDVPADVEKGWVIRFPEYSAEQFEREQNFIHGSSMYRKKAFDEVGGYLDQGTDPEDHNLFLRILRSDWEAEKAPDTVLYYRQHSEEQANIKNQIKAQLEWYKEKHDELVEAVATLNDVVAERERQMNEIIVEKDKEIERLNALLSEPVAKKVARRVKKTVANKVGKRR